MSKSIMHNKGRGCYLCEKHGGHIPDMTLQEHHCFGGPNRKLSEKYGLKVYLCLFHHTQGKEAVHNNASVMQEVHEDGQRAFEAYYPDLSFREIFGRNYI